MSNVNIWLLFVVLGAGTFLLRLSFIQFGEFVGDLPDAVQDTLELIPVAVLAALVFPRLFLSDGTGVQIVGNVYLLTGVLSGVVAWRSGNLLLTIVFGIGLLWTLQNPEFLLNFVAAVF
jgi:branched-subunit amino acid transport protein